MGTALGAPGRLASMNARMTGNRKNRSGITARNMLPSLLRFEEWITTLARRH
jgi:hypothetical protein